MEAAARLLFGLATALVGALFAVLTIASDRLPAYLQRGDIHALSATSIGTPLIALLAALLNP